MSEITSLDLDRMPRTPGTCALCGRGTMVYALEEFTCRKCATGEGAPVPSTAATFTRGRRDINGRIKEKLDELRIPWTMEHDGGPVRYRVEGVLLTPGEAADKYLPGGFAGNFGQS